MACIKESTATYEDSIVDDFFGDSFDDSFDNDSFDDDEGFFDADDEESDEEPATKFVQDTKYRNKDTGKCMFGVLAGKNSSWSRSIKAKDGSRSIFEKGSIMAVNDAKTFGIWKSGSKCDSIEGMQEPSMTPPLLDPTEDTEDTSFSILVSLMCRSVKFKPTQTTVEYSPMAKATRMVPDNKTYHQSSPEEGLKNFKSINNNEKRCNSFCETENFVPFCLFRGYVTLQLVTG